MLRSVHCARRHRKLAVAIGEPVSPVATLASGHWRRRNSSACRLKRPRGNAGSPRDAGAARDEDRLAKRGRRPRRPTRSNGEQAEAACGVRRHAHRAAALYPGQWRRPCSRPGKPVRRCRAAMRTPRTPGCRAIRWCAREPVGSPMSPGSAGGSTAADDDPLVGLVSFRSALPYRWVALPLRAGPEPGRPSLVSRRWGRAVRD